MKTVRSAPQAGKPRLTTSAMIASIAAEGQKTKPAPFGHALVELARSRPEVVGMTADLGKYTDLHIFAKEFPDRYYQMGMAEQLCSEQPPDSPQRASCPLRRHMPCSHRGAPTISFIRPLRRKTAT